MATRKPATICVYLPDEGVDTWRPVQAEPLGKRRFRILSEKEDPEDETWEFDAGDVVRCKKKTLLDGVKPVRCLVVVARVDEVV